MPDPLRPAAQALLDAIEREIPIQWKTMVAGEAGELAALATGALVGQPHVLAALAAGWAAQIEAHVDRGDRGIWLGAESAALIRDALAAPQHTNDDVLWEGPAASLRSWAECNTSHTSTGRVRVVRATDQPSEDR